MAEFLIDQGADLNARNNVRATPQIASHMFLISRSTFAQHNETALLKAAWEHQVPLVEFLVENGAEVDVRSQVQIVACARRRAFS